VGSWSQPFGLPCIEFNGLDPAKVSNLVVEAMDAPGPYQDHTISLADQGHASLPMVCNCPHCVAPTVPAAV